MFLVLKTGNTKPIPIRNYYKYREVQLIIAFCIMGNIYPQPPLSSYLVPYPRLASRKTLNIDIS